MKRLSLRTRLVSIFTILILLSWVISSAIAYVKVRHRIRLAYDAEQIMFAKRLERSGLDDLLTIQAKNNNSSFHPDKFTQARDAFAFAIFTTDGKKLITDRDGVPDFFYSATDTQLGESPEFRESKLWRVLWLKSQDRRFIIAVGQENAYRTRLAKSILLDHQVIPWGILIPIMLVIIILMINRELAPLKRVTSELKQRKPDDEMPIEEKRLPPEVQPFVDALNLLFARIGDMLKRERRFVSDAAHELRSPLTALRVQTEVAQMTVNKPEVQKKALNNLTVGIDRASRLVDQLLTLSRLDAQSDIPEQKSINWQRLIQEMQPTFFASAKEKQINLQINYQGMPPDRQGNMVLLSLLIRNLVDNALHYTPVDGSVSVTLTEQQMVVEDSGPGVTQEHLQRLGERFYRPPGQTKIGSGLGISIVKQIAELHGLKISFANREEGGFSVRVGFWQ